MDIETLRFALSFLPPQVQAFVLGGLCILGALSLFALSLNKLLLTSIGAPQPNDPEWKTALYRRLAWIDALGLNATTIRSWLELARKEQVIRELVVKVPSVPPPAHFAGDDTELHQ